MERSFAKEVASLRLGDGEVFQGEGILAITKALLQSGVAYVGGYQGAPVSHLMDVLSDAKPLLDQLGVHFEACANEASAAAMLGASINYPLRGAVVWKSVVGTNVASDALSNLASAGVTGGALILIGEDYGEGASIIQERSHAFAMKSQMWLLDPRPDLQHIAGMVETAFELSEATNTPVMMEFRIRACHLTGRFDTKANRAPSFGQNHQIEQPVFDYAKVCLPPSTYAQEKHKIAVRLPAALDFIRKHKLNETFPGRYDDVGIILQGGLYNSVLRALRQLGLADAFGNSDLPILALNVTYPLLADEIAGFCAGKRAVLMVEEGNPDYLEQAVNAKLRKADLQTVVVGKDVLPMAGEYTQDVLVAGLAKFVEGTLPRGLDVGPAGAVAAAIDGAKARAAVLLGGSVPKRPPGFCVGCPERPVFSALKLVERELGKVHVSADIGCHTFSTLPPFNIGNTVLGYGLGLAASKAVSPAFAKRVVTVMGDGGFWHNGITTGLGGSLLNATDSVMLIFDNGYSSATGQQLIPSSTARTDGGARISIQSMLKAFGVTWTRTVRTYNVATMVKTLRRAMTTEEGGLKVIVAAGECQLARQRRIKPLFAKRVAAGGRATRTRFGIDAETCTGDHSCIRLSGCPSLTIKPNPDPLRLDPIAHVDQGCVGCGLCGEVSHAAVLCPSFYQATVVHNPRWHDRLLSAMRRRVIGALAG
jgi:indolepyruvate ferredoxin oxidoreductase alpha subunit